MDKDAIEKIESLVRDSFIVEIEGRQYSAKNLEPVIFEPRAEALETHSLTAIVDFLTKNQDAITATGVIIHVVDYKTVSVLSELSPELRRRDTYIATGLDETAEYPFGKFMPVEEFIIRLNSQFAGSDDNERLCKFVSKVTIENGITKEDDGITQVATVKKSVSGAITEIKSAPKSVKLRPFRTFLEIEQPESEMLFRMKEQGQEIACALFEADGGRWKYEAIDRIKKYLQEYLPDFVVIA